MSGQGRRLDRRQSQAALRAPPEDVLSTGGPLCPHQEIDLSLVEIATKMTAEIRELLGVAEQFIDARAVGARITPDECRRKMRIAFAKPTRELRDTDLANFSPGRNAVWRCGVRFGRNI